MAEGRTGSQARCQRIAKEVVTTVLAAVWSRLSPAESQRPASMAASDAVQRSMNLVMPLPFPNLLTRAELSKALFAATDEIVVGLNNLGTFHFARFDVIHGNLCLFSVYDGDFAGSIRDLIAAAGNAIDRLLEQVKDPPPIPVRSHPEEFVAWAQARDAYQISEFPTDHATGGLDTLERDMVLTLHRHQNVQLSFYRTYPGFSAAQIRDRLSARIATPERR